MTDSEAMMLGRILDSDSCLDRGHYSALSTTVLPIWTCMHAFTYWLPYAPSSARYVPNNCSPVRRVIQHSEHSSTAFEASCRSTPAITTEETVTLHNSIHLPQYLNASMYLPLHCIWSARIVDSSTNLWGVPIESYLTSESCNHVLIL